MSLRDRLADARGETNPLPRVEEQPADEDGAVGIGNGPRPSGSPAAARSPEAALSERLRDTATSATPPRPFLRQSREAPSDPYALVKTRVHGSVINKLGSQLFGAGLNEDLTSLVENAVDQELSADGAPLTRDEHLRVVREIADDILGYGPLEPFLADDSVTEVMVNGYDQIYVERAGKIEPGQAAFTDDTHLLRIIDKIVSQVGRRIDEGSPMVDARLPDGSRVNAIIAPLSLRGPTLTIRKFARDPYTIHDLIGFGTVTRKAADFMAACVRGKLNVLITGGTGTGKTTLLNAISAFIPNEERIITIEDAAELQLQQEHVVTLEARPPNIEGEGEIRIRELVRNALRMRPDRIVVGEVRGAETLDMLRAMNTGHEGSLTTIHANSARDGLSRLETLVLTSGVDLPLRAIREQISSALDLIIHLVRLVDGSRKIAQITEVLRMESDVITLQEIFRAPLPDGSGFHAAVALLGPLEYTGLKPHFLDKLAAHDVHVPPEFFTAGDLEVMRSPVRNLRFDQP